MLETSLLILCGYLCGSVSFAYISARLWRKIDLRTSITKCPGRPWF